MVTSIAATGPLWGDGVTLAAQSLRLLTVSAAHPVSSGVQIAGGVHPGAGTPLKVAAGGGMTTTVQPGFATVQGTVSGTQGAYTVGLTSAGTLTHATSDPSNPRRDLIVATITDNGDATTTTVVQIITGTPAASPSDPAIPGNSLTLARVLIPASASSVSTITDLRIFATSLGGIVVATSGTTIAGPYEGLARYDTDTDIMSIYDGAAWQQVAASGAGRGIIAKGFNTVVSTAFNSTTDVVIQTLASVPMVAGRRYKITSFAPIGNNGGTNASGELVRLKHKIGSTVKNTSYFLTDSAISGLTPNTPTWSSLIDDATTGTFSVSLTGALASGSGNHQIIPDTNSATLMRPYIEVEDLGTGG